MNIMVFELSRDLVNPIPDRCSTKLCVEDNIGEGIHIHWRNLTLGFTIKDFETFTNNLEQAEKGLPDGNC